MLLARYTQPVRPTRQRWNELTRGNNLPLRNRNECEMFKLAQWGNPSTCTLSTVYLDNWSPEHGPLTQYGCSMSMWSSQTGVLLS